MVKSKLNIQPISLTLFDETKSVIEWQRDSRCQISVTTLYRRIREGWALTDPSIIKSLPIDSPFNFRFEAFTSTGESIGRCQTINEAEALILECSSRGTVVDTTIDRHIQVPRKKAHHPITTGNAIMLEAFGETKSVVDWARDARSRVAANTIYARIRSKWEPEEAITTPPSGNLVSKMKEASGRLFEAYGESKPMTAWLKDPKCEVSYAALWRRLNKGIPFEQALKSNRPNPSGSDLLRLGSKPLDAFGESKSLREWLNDPRCEIREVSLRVKLKQGIPLEQALRKSKIGPRKK